ncbi:MAG: hypothetical protein J0M04_17190 [Verrucomicrobia bacterium]|nr:hypothetical protein [Verrucomicrobiota bacterium]
MRTFLLLLTACVLPSCVGYRVGNVKPHALESVKTIAVPMTANDTQHPRAEVLATSALTGAFAQDGTYRVGSVGNSDAVLETRLRSIRYSAIRSQRLDSLRPEELSTVVTIDWVLKDARDPSKVLARGSNTGNSQLFVDADLQTARNNALPDALERAGTAIVSRLANGF